MDSNSRPQTRPYSWRKAWLIGSIFGLTLLLAAFIYHASVFRPLMNFHEVDAGKFFRSAQLHPDEIKEIVAQYGIKTVINLRGTHPDQTWYADERDALQGLGVRLVSVAFSTDTVPPKSELESYLAALENSPRPILVHCRAGADRTGEATAIYALEYMHATRDVALEQLSLRYLHVQMFQPAKRFLIEHYQGKDWVKNQYDPCSSEFLPYSSHWDCPADKYPRPPVYEVISAGWSVHFQNWFKDL